MEVSGSDEAMEEAMTEENLAPGHTPARDDENDRGRPGRLTLYRPEFADQAAKACQAGFTDEELGELFGVSRNTVLEWRVAHPAFRRASQVGKRVADNRVERTLYQRAIGYDYDETEVHVVNGHLQTVTLRKHMPGDVRAATYWLRNRRPGQWNDRRTVEVDVVGSLADRLNAARARMERGEGGETVAAIASVAIGAAVIAAAEDDDEEDERG